MDPFNGNNIDMKLQVNMGAINDIYQSSVYLGWQSLSSENNHNIDFAWHEWNGIVINIIGNICFYTACPCQNGYFIILFKFTAHFIWSPATMILRHYKID